MRKKITFIMSIGINLILASLIYFNMTIENTYMMKPATVDAAAPVTISYIYESIDNLQYAPAERLTPPVQTTTTTQPIPVGLLGRPFAPEGLSDCDEFNFYRIQWGLPERFSQLAWRESNCRNEDIVKTYCCYGYLQLYVYQHLDDHRVVGGYHTCGVYSHEDINSDNGLDKQRQVCAAAVLYSVVGYSAWSTG